MNGHPIYGPHVDDELCEVAGEASGAEGDSGEWSGSGANMDTVAGERRSQPGEAEEVWREYSTGAAGPAGGASFDLRAACG
jgi:hypothetical protein